LRRQEKEGKTVGVVEMEGRGGKAAGILLGCKGWRNVRL